MGNSPVGHGALHPLPLQALSTHVNTKVIRLAFIETERNYAGPDERYKLS